jgi:hypothetical protein
VNSPKQRREEINTKDKTVKMTKTESQDITDPPINTAINVDELFPLRRLLQQQFNRLKRTCTRSTSKATLRI